METSLRVNLIRWTQSPEELVALGAKLCYSKAANLDTLEGRIEANDQSEFIRQLVEMNHESVMEHACFTFAVEGVSRSLLAQITRHRIASFSVQSQRYVSYENGFNYIIPEKIKALGDEDVNEFRNQMEIISVWYKGWQEKLGGNGESSNEDARAVLPNACETRFLVTMNVRELMHFFKMRMCNRAQSEIRHLANAMWVECMKVAPTLFSNAGASCLRGKCPEGKKSCGQSVQMKSQREKDLLHLYALEKGWY